MLSEYRRWAIILIALPFVVAFARWHAIALLYQTSAANEALVDVGVGTPVQSLPYVLSEIKAAVFYYLSHFAVPLTQSVDPYFRTVRSIFEPGFLIAVAILAILLVVAVRLSKQQPVITFSIAALLVSPLLSYSLIPLADIVAEHRVYIAGLGFDLLVAGILIRRPRIMFPSLAALAVAFTISTVARNTIWASDLTLWRQAEKNSGNHVRPHSNLGVALQVAGQPDAALEEYRHALSIRSDLPLVYSNMGTIYLGQKRFDEAETVLRRAIELNPSMSQPYINLAAINVHRKKADEALEFIGKAETAGAERYWVHFVRAEALTLSEQFEAARREYELAAKFSEGHLPLQEEIQTRLAVIGSQIGSAK
jgi:Tfp pilus assembly protein PilF